jgi:integrase
VANSAGWAGMTSASRGARSRSGGVRVMVHGVPMETTPKTTAGQRRVGLDEVTLAVPKEQQRRQRAEELASAPGFWRGDGHVFNDEVGRSLIPEYVTKLFTRAVRRAGLPPMRFHDTRHWHATAMLRAGVDPKVAAGRLGHSSTVITQNLYQHRVEQLDRSAAEKVAGIIFEPSSKDVVRLQEFNANASLLQVVRTSRADRDCSGSCGC